MSMTSKVKTIVECLSTKESFMENARKVGLTIGERYDETNVTISENIKQKAKQVDLCWRNTSYQRGQ